MKYFNSRNSIEFGITNFEFLNEKNELNIEWDISKFQIPNFSGIFSIKFKGYPIKKIGSNINFLGAKFYKKI
jgi:hypothetical protein